MVERVLATNEALDLIARLKRTHGPLMFHQSGGCCDGRRAVAAAAGLMEHQRSVRALQARDEIERFIRRQHPFDHAASSLLLALQYTPYLPLVGRSVRGSRAGWGAIRK